VVAHHSIHLRLVRPIARIIGLNVEIKIDTMTSCAKPVIVKPASHRAFAQGPIGGKAGGGAINLWVFCYRIGRNQSPMLAPIISVWLRLGFVE
tara:strand:+ start:395 stop:673 length:279 start_codon:yes stop_codon:yes gene_type:complete